MDYKVTTADYLVYCTKMDLIIRWTTRYGPYNKVDYKVDYKVDFL